MCQSVIHSHLANLIGGDRSHRRRRRESPQRRQRSGLFGMHFLTVLWARISASLPPSLPPSAAAPPSFIQLYHIFIEESSPLALRRTGDGLSVRPTDCRAEVRAQPNQKQNRPRGEASGERERERGSKPRT